MVRSVFLIYELFCDFPVHTKYYYPESGIIENYEKIKIYITFS